MKMCRSVKLFGGDAIQNRLRVKAGVEQRGVARDFVPDEITIHGKTFARRREHAEFAPDGQIFRRRQPAVGDALRALAAFRPISGASAAKFIFFADWSGFFQRGQFAFGNARRAGRRGG